MYESLKRYALFAIILTVLAGCEENTINPSRSQPEEPYVIIGRPPPGGGIQYYSKVIVFGWRSGGENTPEYTRHMWSQVIDTDGVHNPGFDIVKDLNENPWRYEDKWSPWMPFDSPTDSGRTTIIGDDEALEPTKHYLFSVQAKDNEGQVSGTFDESTNARRFLVKNVPGPLLMVIDPLLTGFKFLGTKSNPKKLSLPPGVPLNFRWYADASHYGGDIAGYRYGWDIIDPEEWGAPFRPDNTSSPEIQLYSGIHTLYIESADLAGNITNARIEVSVLPFPMDRNLLWVDDFFSVNQPIPDYSHPPENKHDMFWLDICSRAYGFDSAIDVFDCAEHRFFPPGIECIGRYKNIIWTYSSSNDSWTGLVHFTPESQLGEGGQQTINYLSIFLSKGGHLWTLGRSERSGGLASVLATSAQSFPVNLKCEITGNRDDCEGDRSGVFCMAYKDYCVTMIDKISGILRTDKDMPVRALPNFDVMAYAVKDDSDPVTSAHPGLPARLDLWEEVTKPGRYFEPDSSGGPGGFTYVEIYDPEYWMNRNLVTSQSCFHPLYRMKAVNDASVLNDCAVAIWVNLYDDVIPDVSTGIAVAAPSFHFGFPLWFFKRESIDSIVDVVFDEWGIKAAHQPAGRNRRIPGPATKAAE